MTIDKNYDTKLASISAISSDKIHKHEYLTGEAILPSGPSQIIQRAKFTYSKFGNALENQTKTIKDQREKQIRTIEKQEEKRLATLKNDDLYVIVK